MKIIKSVSENSDDSLAVNVTQTSQGVTLEIYLEEGDTFPFADLHVEIYEGNLRFIIAEPDDVQDDPTQIVSIPLDTKLKWDRKTGEDILEE
jgi:hypothetical protein